MNPEPKTSRRYSKIFHDPLLLEQLFLDWNEGKGMRISVLARKYKCDRSSIRYHLRLENTGRKKALPPYTPPPRPPKKVGKYDHLMNEDLNQGRDYKQYFKKQ